MSVRLLILGLSGASLDFLKPLSSKGWLPNIDYLLRHGTSGHVDSPLPPLSSPEWAAILSGHNPSYTGLFDQQNRELRSYFPEWLPLNQDQNFTILKRSDRKTLRTALVNIPLKTDKRRVNGIVIDWDRMFREKNLIPSHLFPFFPRVVPVDWNAGTSGTEDAAAIARLEQDTDNTIYQGLVLSHLLKTGSWDMVLSSFTLLDRILSRYWDNIEGIRREGPCNPFEEALLSSLKILDDIVGQLIKSLDPDSMVIIFSGHSYGPLKHAFSINRFLERLGHLRVRKEGKNGSLLNRYVSPILRASGIRRQHLKTLFGYFSLGELAESIALPFSEDLGIFDWKKSRAFSLTQFGIHINLKGREIHGTVSPGREYRAVGNEIIESLVKLRDPEYGDPVFTDVRWKDEMYSGPNLINLPDIIVNHWTGGFSFTDYDKIRHQSSIFAKIPGMTGAIRKNGFFLIKGPNVPKRALLADPFSIFDIAPTGLSHLNVQAPWNMEGRPFPTLDSTLLKPESSTSLL